MTKFTFPQPDEEINHETADEERDRTLREGEFLMSDLRRRRDERWAWDSLITIPLPPPDLSPLPLTPGQVALIASLWGSVCGALAAAGIWRLLAWLGAL